MVLGYDFLHRKVRIREISFQAVPEHVLPYLLLVDGYRDVLAYVKELVVPAPVHVLLRERAFCIGLTQPSRPLSRFHTFLRALVSE